MVVQNLYIGDNVHYASIIYWQYKRIVLLHVCWCTEGGSGLGTYGIVGMHGMHIVK